MKNNIKTSGYFTKSMREFFLLRIFAKNISYLQKSIRNLSDKKVDLYSLQEVMDYTFTNVQYLEKALTHPSQKQLSSEDTYERTEFLGDRVLGLIIAELLMKEFPEAAEGELAIRLSALVSGKTLCDVAEEIGLASYISVSDAERLAGTHKRNSVKADCLEAIIGAIKTHVLFVNSA